MQFVLFTPTMVNTYVNQSLTQLRFRQCVDRFGMFFLHDVNLEESVVLEEVAEIDGLDVKRILGASKENRKRKAAAIDTHTKISLGSEPSWEQVKEALVSNPLEVMKKWQWPQVLEPTAIGPPEGMAKKAGEIFRRLTLYAWLLVHPSWSTTKEVRIDTVQDALASWTVESIMQRLKDVSFMACNAGLAGPIPGKMQNWFEDREKLFFRESWKKMSSAWMAMDEGYLNEY